MNYLLILLAVSMAVSGLGWIYFIYFFSIGYGFGVSALAVTMAILFKDVLTIPTALLCVVMFVFGCRLGLYLLIERSVRLSTRRYFMARMRLRRNRFRSL
jgi:uncharacterized membrane protein AbrB (regulator of aidB expression)